jgi:hypothetical protein
MKKLRCVKLLAYLLFAVFLNSCETSDKILNYSPEPDYFTSRNRKVVEHRSKNVVEYSPGQIYTNTKTLYWVDGMGGKDVTWAPWDGKVLKVLPPGTKFTVSRVRARFTLTNDSVVPTFTVSGLPGNEINVSIFRTSGGMSGGKFYYTYNREYFRRE